jgi:hypothetical protein
MLLHRKRFGEKTSFKKNIIDSSIAMLGIDDNPSKIVYWNEYFVYEVFEVVQHVSSNLFWQITRFCIVNSSIVNLNPSAQKAFRKKNFMVTNSSLSRISGQARCGRRS